MDGRLAYWEQRASGEVATILGVNGVAGVGDVVTWGARCGAAGMRN